MERLNIIKVQRIAALLFIIKYIEELYKYYCLIQAQNNNHHPQHTHELRANNVGNRLTRDDNGTITSYTYDNNDRLLTETGSTYTYDNNGNTLSKTTASDTVNYTYDYRNKLTGVTTSTSDIQYAYDAFGIRVQKTVDGVMTNFLVDHNMPFAQVLEERDNAGGLIASYIHGDDLIGQKRGTDTSYYHYDGLGSTRVLTDSTATTTDTYNYEAFGTTLNQTGTTENNFLFTGEQYDPNIGFYYLRARYYNPSIGRFITLDLFEGVKYDPISLHKYLYVNVDPVNNIDPSGMIKLAELNIVQTILSFFRFLSIKLTYVMVGSSMILFRIANFATQVLYRCINSVSRLARLVQQAIAQYPKLANLPYTMKHHIIPEYILRRMGLIRFINKVPLVTLNPAYHQFITNAISKIVPMDGTPISVWRLPVILVRLLGIYIKYPLPPW